MSIKVGDLEVSPDFEEERRIHPALDVTEDHAYVGVWVPCSIKGKKGRATRRNLPFVIRDDGKQILANNDFLAPLGLKLLYRPDEFENRWSLKHVRDFVERRGTLDPGRALGDVVGEYAKYIEFMDPRDYVYHALWDVGTYHHPMFNAFPYIYLGGVKRSAKTKTLTLHSLLAFNAIFSGNMSSPSIFRLVQNSRSTLLVDENEKLRDPNRLLDFRQLFLSGYKRGSGVYRVDKDPGGGLHVRRYELYSPKGVANIRGLEDVLEDRCKVTIMRRSLRREICDREINTRGRQWSELRDELYRLYLGHWREIRAKYTHLSELGERGELVNFTSDTYAGNKSDLKYLTARELELWKAPIALAMFFDGHGGIKNIPSEVTFTCSPSSLTSLVVGLAVDCAMERNVESMAESGEVLLASVLLKNVDRDDYYPVKDLRASMQEIYDEDQKWLTTRWVGNVLRRLGFKEKRRVGTGYQYKLNVADVKDLASRMGVEQEPQGGGGELPQIDLMKRLGELHQKVHGETLTPEGFLSMAESNFSGEREERLQEAIQEMIDNAVPFRISPPKKADKNGARASAPMSENREAGCVGFEFTRPLEHEISYPDPENPKKLITFGPFSGKETRELPARLARGLEREGYGRILP